MISFLGAYVANLEKHEGRQRWPYLDEATPPVVTVGVGHALFTSVDACALPFRISATGALASEAIVTKAWSGLKYQTKPSKNQDISIYLEEADIDRILADDLATKVLPICERQFAQFRSFPSSARVAIVDIAFNCGSFAKWPKLVAAIQRKDWATAAQQCWRKPPVSEERNADTKQQFLAA